MNLLWPIHDDVFAETMQRDDDGDDGGRSDGKTHDESFVEDEPTSTYSLK